MPETSENPSSSISAVSVKLPPFWSNMVTGWFVQAESVFRRARVTVEETRYDHVLSVLPQDVIADVLDVIELNAKVAEEFPVRKREDPSLPDPTPYSDLKNALISRNSRSEKQRFEQILSRETIGDRKPSEFYRHLKQLAGDSKLINEELIKTLWLRALPAQMQQSLISSGRSTMTDLCALADALLEVTRTQPSSSLFAIGSTPSPQDDRMSRLENQISALTKAFEEMSGTRGKSEGKSRNPRGRSKSRNRKDVLSANGLCFYHENFKEKAHSCRPGCQWKSGN